MAKVDQRVTSSRIQEKLQKLETKLISEIQSEVNILFEETIQDIKNDEITAREFGYIFDKENQEIWHNRLQVKNIPKENEHSSEGNALKTKKEYRLPDKVFMQRESYLTHLFQISHMKCIYNIFFAMLLILTLHTFIQDYVVEGRINLGLETIQASYGGFNRGLFLWCCMNLAVFGVYYAFKLWAIIRFSLRKNKYLQALWNYSCLILFVTYQLTFAYAVSISNMKLKLSLVTAVAVLLEMTRLMMKMHAFVRTNAGFQLSGKLKTDDTSNNSDNDCEKSVAVPAFSKLLYFLFAPTLLYRDEYPRTSTIRWKFVAARLSEIIAINFFQAYLHERYLSPYYKNFGKANITPENVIQAVFGSMMPSIIIWLTGFYVILHSTQNAAAEVLRFGDRMFYTDWWTSRNYATFYRKWNIIVHDWLYEYIYKDIYSYVFKGSKSASTIIVFFSSAFVHEYILSVLLGFVYPVMFFLFMIYSVTVILLFKNFGGKNWGNFYLWFTFITGNGAIISFYSMEYFARQNCPVGDKWIDYVIPISWSCNGIISTNM